MANKPKRIPNLKAALATVEDDVNEPTRRKSSSFAAVVSDLDIGETASKAQRIDASITIEDYTANAAEWREQLRNTCTSAVTQSKRRTGGEYTIEVADLITAQRVIYMVALITRTA